MVEILALFMGMGLTAWAGYLVVARGKRQLDAAVAYRSVARNLGLEVDTRGVSLQGHLGDRRLWVGEVMVGHGPDRRTAVWGVVDLRRPLGLGLQVRRRGLSERVFRRNRSPGIELGQQIDRRVEVRGDHAPQVRTLLGAREVREALSQLMDFRPDVVITDNSVRVHLARALARETELDELVQRMLSLARSLEDSRRLVSPPDRLAVLVPEWEAVATRLGLELEACLPAVVGEVTGRKVVATVTRGERGYETSVRLWFAEHRPLGLRVRPQVEPDGYWSVGQDIQLGDDRFDQAFVVKGWDPGRVRERLHADARGAFLEANALGRLNVEDVRLTLGGLPLDGPSVEEAIGRALAVADALGW